MNLRVVYGIIFGLIGSLIGGVVAVISTIFTMGIFWLLILGDSPWPAWTDVIYSFFPISVFLGFVIAAVFLGVKTGKRLEQDSDLERVKRRGNVHLLLSIVVWSVSLGLFMWYWLNYRNSQLQQGGSQYQQMQKEGSESDTSMWQTYRDDELGYSLRIPPTWINKEFIEPHSDDYFKVAFGEPDGILLYIGEEEAYKVYEFGCNVFTVSAYPTKFSLEGTISQVMNNRSRLDDAARIEVLVGSQKAVQFDESLFPSDSRDRNPQLDGLTTFVKHNDVVFMFVGRSCATEKDKFKDLYKMILKSVKFFEIPQQEVEQSVIDTTTWPTYVHPTLGYSIKMHPDFQVRNDTERFVALTGENKLIAAELDINIFTYGDPNFRGSKEEHKRLYKKLLAADENTEFTEEDTIILKIANFNLDGRLLPQVLVGSNTYSTFYPGERQFFVFELEDGYLDDLEKYRLLLNAAFSTFRFNSFNP